MAALELLALDEATPQIRAPGTGDTYTAPRPLAITGVAGTTALSITGGTQTTDVKIVDITGTFNNAAVTFTGIKANFTDTASAAASLLLDLQVGGVSKIQAMKNGRIFVADSSTAAAPGVEITMGTNNTGLYKHGVVGLGFTSNGVYTGAVYQGIGFIVPDANTYSWNSQDLFLYRDAANTLALRNSTNAQTFNVYNTYTDGSNYERASLKFASNVMTLSMDAAGTGTKRDFTIDISGGTAKGITLKSDASGYIDNAFATTIAQRFTTGGIYLQATQRLYFSPTTVTTSIDCAFGRSAAGILAVTDGSTGGATIEFTEQTAPSAPASNKVRIYAVDNGAGKTQLMALFASGAAQQIAIEP